MRSSTLSDLPVPPPRGWPTQPSRVHGALGSQASGEGTPIFDGLVHETVRIFDDAFAQARSALAQHSHLEAIVEQQIGMDDETVPDP